MRTHEAGIEPGGAHGAETSHRARKLALKLRGKTIEPVFGQIKHGFAALTRRGLLAAKADWSLLCLAHNLKKLCRAKNAALGQAGSFGC